ncbi:hypothetical protein PR002_g11768 [Phytophthora rubi]|uniref:Uncharacterized protein n=1 Tax=Phytophthora rubi TaxID=129364 RepID=A0A6A3M4G3_9STRA|nr:hypothetical protein PR002_g11768 [Phytophthora rubi]
MMPSGWTAAGCCLSSDSASSSSTIRVLRKGLKSSMGLPSFLLEGWLVGPQVSSPL